MIYLMFFFGTFIGSFLNVVIYRLNPALRQAQGGVFGRRSMCFNCKTILKWYDLVPILSFFWLCGRCRYCQKKISWQYPMVEFLSGILWLAVFYKNQLDGNFQFSILNFQSIFNFQFLNFFYYIFVLSALLVIAVYDFKWYIIPDKIIYPAIALALIFNLFNAFSAIGGSASGGKSLNIETFKLFTAFIAFLFFFSIYFFSRGRAMGLGDGKLAFLIGLFLIPLLTAITLILAFIIGALFGIILVVFKKKSWKSQIAFGPFLIISVFITFFFS
ncbi:MAG: prepilin peptidase, partial [Patescibacteria group bacterium]